MKTLPNLARCAARTTMCTLLALAVASAGAQALPKQFDFEVTYTWSVVQATQTALADKSNVQPMTLTMVATGNAKGGAFMHQMFGQCAGSSLTLGDSYEITLGCVYEDKDGDKLFETARSSTPGGGGKLVFVGGTGKFAGLHCDGSYTTYAMSKEFSKGISKKTGNCRVS